MSFDDNYNKILEDKAQFGMTANVRHKEKHNLMFIPTENESVHTWLQRQGRAVFESREANITTHINNGKRPWYTHTSAGACFMCDDLSHIKIQNDLLDALDALLDLSHYVWFYHIDKDTKQGSWGIRLIDSDC